MSHFCGLVFLRPQDDLDEVLAPFNEQDEEYFKFVDCTDEVKAKWESMPDTCPSSGTYVEESDWTELVNDIWTNAPDKLEPEQEGGFMIPYTKDKYPTPTDIAEDKDYEIVEDETAPNGVRFIQRVTRDWALQPSKEKYPTIEEFAKEYFGYHKEDDRFGYSCNPNAKWDWYDENGRWSGFLINKEGNHTNWDFLTEIDWVKMFAEGNIPFCFVDAEGVWHEKGEMGWFGTVSNEKKKVDWVEEFKAYVKEIMADDQVFEIEVVNIDYHI